MDYIVPKIQNIRICKKFKDRSLIKQILRSFFSIVVHFT